MSTVNSVKATIVAALPSGGVMSYVVGFIILVLGITALYYLYSFLFGMPKVQSTVIVGSSIPANQPTASQLYTIPPPYEGGEYSVSFWSYITGWKDKLGQRKHILEIRGSEFSTLVESDSDDKAAETSSAPESVAAALADATFPVSGSTITVSPTFKSFVAIVSMD